MNIILLQPADVLFFRDGRPMAGSLAGHGAAWPMPHITNSALHAALHRSGLDGHKHDQIRNGNRALKDAREFGSLVTAGPFPVYQPTPDAPGTWFFPRPLDLMDDTLQPALLPTDSFDSTSSNLPDPLEYAVANRLPPSKNSAAKAWFSTAAYQRYLNGNNGCVDSPNACNDSDFSDAEATIGIAIDPETGTTGQGEAAGKIYSPHYLRLRDDWRLGVLARTREKNGDAGRRDLIPKLINEKDRLLVGGQQRLCTATLLNGGEIPLPRRATPGFNTHNGKYLVKWVLLSPAIWPEIEGGLPQRRKSTIARQSHPGGWLPNWIDPEDSSVLLRVISEEQRHNRRGLNHQGVGYATDEGGALPIAAKLVAALVPKPIPVTGWAAVHPEGDRARGGAKTTHLAVPAGAMYYFEADTLEDAGKLATALNWHGARDGKEVKNRRSTLMGEKGFGLGVCGTWKFFGT
ncbi:MAG TPA: type III-B CRISPR module-associated Cmr3 family protein [Verrucomicrobiota bacterium]|nr:type III-B CRISPR module-associated Cmr3 family protein [Verrucomicrobiota bacterium]HNT14581.1 type III-B CRISPR module-associated Cmr3 family protein [Verrucomicrobiota bacterium]